MLLPHPAAHSTVSYQQAPELQTLPDSGNLFLSPLQSEDMYNPQFPDILPCGLTEAFLFSDLVIEILFACLQAVMPVKEPLLDSLHFSSSRIVFM